MNVLKVLCSMVVVLAMATTLTAAPAAVGGARAEIPFAFHLSGKTFAPGVYIFESAPSRGIVTMTDPDGQRHMMLTSGLGDPNRPVFDPRLCFVRTHNGMMLDEVWMNAGFGGHKLHQPAPATGERVEIALAMLRR